MNPDDWPNVGSASKLPVDVTSKSLIQLLCWTSTCPEVPAMSCSFGPSLFEAIRVFSAMRLCMVL